jgi:RHS repeat-associated protein
MTYDDLGRRKQLNDPESGLSDRTYNAFGEIVVEQMGDPATMPASQVERIVYARDRLGRVIRETPSSESPSTFTWDTEPFGIGRLASSASADGTTRGYSYDPNGRLKQERWTIDDAASPYVVDYAYDGFGRIGRVNYPTVSGRARFAASYHYDQTGVADAVCDARATPTAPCNPSSTLALWKATARLADGQITDEAFANGEVTHRRYVDPRGLVTTIETTLGVSSTQSLTYDYDLNGNLQTRGGFASGPTETFTYDTLNRLTNVSRSDRSSTFTYDDLGNFLRRTNKDAQGTPTSQLDYSFTTGATPHPDLVVNGTRYAFDGKGRNTMIGPSSAPQREVAYAPFDLPRQISVGGGAQQWTFHYDADHHRVQKISDASNGSVTVGDLYEKNRDVEGLSHVFYVHGPERVVAQLKVDSSGHDQFFDLHDDHLGSVETMTDQGGLVNTISYDVFGTRTPSQSLDLHKGFTFQSHDDDISAQADDPGLIDMKGRMYDPKIGRFLTADPFVSAPFASQGHNRYAYAFNNPLGFVDPSGFSSCDPAPSGPPSGFSSYTGIPVDGPSSHDVHFGPPPPTGGKGSPAAPTTAPKGGAKSSGPSAELMSAIRDAAEHPTPQPGSTAPPTIQVTDSAGTTATPAGGGGGGGVSLGGGSRAGAPMGTPYALIDLTSYGSGGRGQFHHGGSVPNPEFEKLNQLVMDLTGLGDVQTLLDPTSAGGAKAAAGVGLALNLLPIGRVARASSRALGRALEIAGHVRAPGAAAHHLVAGAAKRAAPARSVLQKFGIGINEAANGVFLSGSVHSPIHTREYYETVNELLGGAESRQQALEALEAIRQGVLSGGFP